MMTLYTGGTFDVLHYGHLDFLKRCRILSGNVVVALNDDDFIEKFKGNPPIMSYKERKKSLEHCPYIDRVVRNIGGNDSKISIEQINPSIIAVGTDWASRDYYSQMGFTQEWLDEKGICLVYIPYGDPSIISTTEIKRRILENENRSDR
jgi:glycerol-3-phosphate cytidylyltransferase